MGIPEDVERALYRALLAGDDTDAALADLRRQHPEHGSELDAVVARLRAAPLDQPGGDDMLRRLVQVRRMSRSDQRYEFVRELGEGGLGTVRIVRDRLLGRKVALKTIHPKRGTRLGEIDPGLVHRFLDEAQVAAQLWHPGIPPVHDMGVNDLGVPFFTMRFVQGHVLADLMIALSQGSKSWTLTRLVRVLAEATKAVAHAHRHRVFHRDLKPTNIVVGRFGEVSVIDWGLAKVHRAVSIEGNQPHVVTDRRDDLYEGGLGSPGYTAPEQWRGEFGPAGDIFSFGCMLHELLVGLPPPIERHSIAYTLPHDARRRDARLAAIAAKAIEVDPAARYATIGGLLEDLVAWLEHRPVAATSISTLDRLRLAWRRLRGRPESPEAPADAVRPAPGEASNRSKHDRASPPTLPPLTMAMGWNAGTSLGSPAEGTATPHRTEASRQRLAAIASMGPPSSRCPKQHKIGQGGMATIYLTQDLVLHRSIAIKHVRSDLARDFDGEILARTLDEAQIAAQLDHPAILAPHDLLIDENGRLAMILPLVTAGTLADRLREGDEGRWRDLMPPLLQVCRGLAFAHSKGVIHRDVKPGNILLGDHGDAYLTDWGLALLYRADDDSESRIQLSRGEAGKIAEETLTDEVATNGDPITQIFGQLAGTPVYMSPEQIQGEPAGIRPASDVFSLGATLYEVLTGTRAFQHFHDKGMLDYLALRATMQAPPVRSKNPDIPRAIADVCDRALRPNPLERWRDAGELATALQAALD